MAATAKAVAAEIESAKGGGSSGGASSEGGVQKFSFGVSTGAAASVPTFGVSSTASARKGGPATSFVSSNMSTKQLADWEDGQSQLFFRKLGELCIHTFECVALLHLRAHCSFVPFGALLLMPDLVFSKLVHHAP